jgi:hypothetical protein
MLPVIAIGKNLFYIENLAHTPYSSHASVDEYLAGISHHVVEPITYTKITRKG